MKVLSKPQSGKNDLSMSHKLVVVYPSGFIFSVLRHITIVGKKHLEMLIRKTILRAPTSHKNQMQTSNENSSKKNQDKKKNVTQINIKKIYELKRTKIKI